MDALQLEQEHAEALRLWRDENRLSQRQLAERLGVDQAQVCKAELGERALAEVTAIRLERLTAGKLKAKHYVHRSKRDRIAELIGEPPAELDGEKVAS